MRALRSYGAGDIRVVDVDEPTPSDDKVIVEVEWCGICGSDLHLWHMGTFSSIDPSRLLFFSLLSPPSVNEEERENEETRAPLKNQAH